MIQQSKWKLYVSRCLSSGYVKTSYLLLAECHKFARLNIAMALSAPTPGITLMNFTCSVAQQGQIYLVKSGAHWSTHDLLVGVYSLTFDIFPDVYISASWSQPSVYQSSHWGFNAGVSSTRGGFRKNAMFDYRRTGGYPHLSVSSKKNTFIVSPRLVSRTPQNSLGEGDPDVNGLVHQVYRSYPAKAPWVYRLTMSSISFGQSFDVSYWSIQSITSWHVLRLSLHGTINANWLRSSLYLKE